MTVRVAAFFACGGGAYGGRDGDQNPQGEQRAAQAGPRLRGGIFWVLGRYDRPWGPERPIFGKIRYMSSENTAWKLSVKNYIAKYA